MTKPTFFLTEVAQDWDGYNLTVTKETLIEAEEATLRRVDKIRDPLFDTPNFPNILGYTRWVMVQKHLEMAAKRFKGITPRWVNLGGSNVLELWGQNTIVTPCHLLTEGQTPNNTDYRRDLRIQNQVCPFLFPSQNGGGDDSDEQRLRILLVHGGKYGPFAFLRAYIDPDDHSIYRDLSENIMLKPILLPSIDVEPVAEPQVELKPAAVQRKRASGEAS